MFSKVEREGPDDVYAVMIAEVKFEDESRCCSTLAVSSWSLKDELDMFRA